MKDLPIKIKQAININYINELYKNIYDENENFIDLILPKKIIHQDFSVLFSFIQLVATWVRKSNSGKLVLPISEQKQLPTYFDQEFVYPSIVLSWEKQILDEDGQNLKPELKRLSREHFKKMDYLKLNQKESVPIYCFDHDRSKRGYSRFFYDPYKKMISEDELDFNLSLAFKKIGSNNRSVFNASLQSKIDDFIKITHELFSNTHEHARTDVDQGIYYPNIRSVYFRLQKRRLNTFLKQYSDTQVLLDYFNSNLPLNDVSEVYFLEISVLDSGPGLARRYAGLDNLNEVEIKKEVDLIKECLYKHNTSSKGLKKITKGLGLDRVLNTINNKGFIRIRSGRVDILKDMRNDPYKEPDEPSKIILKDWKNSNENFSIHPECSGSLISIIYPLGNE